MAYVTPLNIKRSSSQSKGVLSLASPAQSPSRDDLLNNKGSPSPQNKRVSNLLGGGPASERSHSMPISSSKGGAWPKLQQIYGVCSQQGRRPYQEDRAVVQATDADLTAYGVFDGHGGDTVSTMLVGPMDFLGRIAAAVRAAKGSVSDALALVYGATHKEVLAHRTLTDTCGSCAVAAVVQRRLDGAYHVHVSNCGDSRCLLYSGATRTALRLSFDHKPDLPAERSRISARGGAVLQGRLFCTRGATAVSRAIGDRVFAAHGLVPDPHVRSVRLGPADAFIILFSDGLTEQMSDDEVCSLVAGHLQRGCSPEQAAKLIVQHAIDHPDGQHRNSSDNVTAIIVKFEWS